MSFKSQSAFEAEIHSRIRLN